MKKNKFSFTLSELMVSFMIIAIIILLAMPAVKRSRDSYTQLTYHVYENLKQVIRAMWTVSETNQIMDAYGTVRSSAYDMQMECALSNGSIISILKPDFNGTYTCSATSCSNTNYSGKSISGKNSKPLCSSNAAYWSLSSSYNFCQRMASFMHIAGSINCRDLLDVSGPTDTYKYPYLNITSATEPSFTTTNGQIYYISKRMVVDKVSSEMGFRLVAVDLNGKKSPNVVSPGSDLKKIPDIVTFLIMDNGEIYPLGVAADNKDIGTPKKPATVNYLNSRIKIYDYNEDSNSNFINAKCYNSSDDKMGTCNFGIEYLTVNGVQAGSYRTMYCKAGNTGNFYSNYCKIGSNIKKDDDKCEKFECRFEVIKPIIRMKN